jgi:hypothetical protein
MKEYINNFIRSSVKACNDAPSRQDGAIMGVFIASIAILVCVTSIIVIFNKPLIAIAILFVCLWVYACVRFQNLPVYTLLLCGPFWNYFRTKAVDLGIESSILTSVFDALVVWIIFSSFIKKLFPAVISKRQQGHKNGIGLIDLGLGIILVLAVVHLFTGNVLLPALYAFKTTYLYILLFFSVRVMRYDVIQIRNFINVFLISVLILALEGLYRYVFYGLSATMQYYAQNMSFTILDYYGIPKHPFITGSSNISSWLLAMAAIMSMSMAINCTSALFRFAYLSAFIIYSIGIVLTFARGSWLAWFIGCGILIITERSKKSLILILLLLCIGVFLFIILPENIQTAFLNPRLDYDVGRFEGWERTISSIIENPLGNGLGTQGWVSYRFENAVASPGEADNWYLKTIAELGILAAFPILFTWFLITSASLVSALKLWI